MCDLRRRPSLFVTLFALTALAASCGPGRPRSPDAGNNVGGDAAKLIRAGANPFPKHRPENLFTARISSDQNVRDLVDMYSQEFQFSKSTIEQVLELFRLAYRHPGFSEAYGRDPGRMEAAYCLMQDKKNGTKADSVRRELESAGVIRYRTLHWAVLRLEAGERGLDYVRRYLVGGGDPTGIRPDWNYGWPFIAHCVYGNERATALLLQAGGRFPDGSQDPNWNGPGCRPAT